MKLFQSLPFKPDAQVLGKQVLRSGTAVAANYRAACRARSHAEFVSKISIVAEEADETLFWLEILNESGLVGTKAVGDLTAEAKELTAIFTASVHTARSRR